MSPSSRLSNSRTGPFASVGEYIFLSLFCLEERVLRFLFFLSFFFFFFLLTEYSSLVLVGGANCNICWGVRPTKSGMSWVCHYTVFDGKVLVLEIWVLYTHLPYHNDSIIVKTDTHRKTHEERTQEDFFRIIFTSHFICKICVWEGAGDRT